MIIKNDTVYVMRVANGYKVSSNLDNSSPFDTVVFQDKGFVSSARDHQDVKSTLFGWLDQHFSDSDLPPFGSAVGDGG